jgi:hypothetical protein
MVVWVALQKKKGSQPAWSHETDLASVPHSLVRVFTTNIMKYIVIATELIGALTRVASALIRIKHIHMFRLKFLKGEKTKTGNRVKTNNINELKRLSTWRLVNR